MKDRRWTLLVAIVSTIAARLIALYALGDVPHVMDEIAYVFQAKTYLTGHVTAPVSLPRAAFALWFVDDRATKYGIFPPGWPAVLAIGTLFHIRAWMNPILHGLTTWMVSKSARCVGGPRARILAAVVYGFSPQALFLAASLMSHTVVAFGAALALWAGISANTVKTSRFAIAVGGAGVATAMLSRPLCGIVVALGLGALLLLALVRKKITIDFCVAAAIPIALGVLVLGGYNKAVTGSAARFPQSVYFDEHAPPLDDSFFQYRPGCNDLGFGPAHGCDKGIKNASHDLKNALSNTGDNLTSWLFLAGGGPLSFVAPFFVLYVARGERRKKFFAIGTTIPAAILLYSLYWYAGTCFGARFYQAALPALLLFGALALSHLDHFKKNATRYGLIAWVALSLPGFVLGVREVGDHYWGLDNRFVAVREKWNHGPAVVLVAFKTDGLKMHYLRATGFTSHSPNSFWHNSVRVLSALTLDSTDPEHDEVVFAKYHPALMSDLYDRYPNRAFYMYLYADSPANDVLERYDPNQYADPDAPKPKDNFDGFVVP
jgi:4-amino-4-deoxy-L-arabinose transferase-like glycosyltransferase